jgi:septal ring-binding cell division protein DamX
MAQQHKLPDEFARFRVQGQNQLLYVLTYGVFKEAARAERRRAAIAVLLGLPPEQLWVRRMESVQRAIRTTLQQ